MLDDNLLRETMDVSSAIPRERQLAVFRPLEVEISSGSLGSTSVSREDQRRAAIEGIPARRPVAESCHVWTLATNVVDDFEAGWIGVNNFSPALAEAPFGGVENSGLGSEGGPEEIDAYRKTKFVSQVNMDG